MCSTQTYGASDSRPRKLCRHPPSAHGYLTPEMKLCRKYRIPSSPPPLPRGRSSGPCTIKYLWILPEVEVLPPGFRVLPARLMHVRAFPNLRPSKQAKQACLARSEKPSGCLLACLSLPTFGLKAAPRPCGHAMTPSWLRLMQFQTWEPASLVGVARPCSPRDMHLASTSEPHQFPCLTPSTHGDARTLLPTALRHGHWAAASASLTT
ncbi:uncharacterized protein LY79DRAFT_216670 [Colletotrichum navitas]|uniref:Uncharacterized protein n=1 Tax=Colletotrichum navitas TaxID=681940 RepID=A0AAD8PZ74_9PEZI|nr:uncharacterized protein LY79DRAFT_216670 [Colletotrichum navitas]KAK1590646.1 hypothetical protein LY79DRAFT_216670 [Colletotrichum navitas]